LFQVFEELKYTLHLLSPEDSDKYAYFMAAVQGSMGKTMADFHHFKNLISIFKEKERSRQMNVKTKVCLPNVVLFAMPAIW
jgi:hypothetical protein